ncbi:MAG: AIDA repeat-containing protein [Lentisphaeria bacterium]|nr:AIDA repeat-containing protein [Lentisphaeria bacterium]
MYTKNIFSGVVSNGLIIDGEHELWQVNVYSGGKVTNITVGGDYGYWDPYGTFCLDIDEGGIASGVTIKDNGELYVGSGGSALNVNWTPTVGVLDIEDGAYVTFVSSYSGVYHGSGGVLLSNTATMNNIVLDGYSNNICIMSGGKVNTAELSNGAELDVMQNGSANDVYVGENAEMYVLSGGRAANIEVGEGGMLQGEAGSYITGIEAEEGAELEFSIASNTRFQGTSNGVRFDFNSRASNFTLKEGMDMEVRSGGKATKITVQDGGEINFDTGAYGSGITLESGAAFVACVDSSTQVYGTYHGSQFRIANGTISNMTVDNAEICIHSGGRASNMTFGYDSELEINSGGYASDINIRDMSNIEIEGGTVEKLTVSSGAMAYVEGTLNNAVVSSGGYMSVGYGTVTGLNAATGAQISFSVNKYTTVSGVIGDKNISMKNGLLSGFTLSGSEENYYNSLMTVNEGGSAVKTVINNGYMNVESSGTALQTTINSGGIMTVYSGAAVDKTTVNSDGYIYVASGAVLNNTTVNSGGYIGIDSGTATLNNTVLNSGAYLYAYESGSTILNDTLVNKGAWLQLNGGVAKNTIIDGGDMSIYDGYAENTVLRRNAYLNISGSMKNVDIAAGATCYCDGTWSGTLTVAGYLNLYGASGSGNINFVIDGNNSNSYNYMLNGYQSKANYSITVSKYADDGTYYIISDADSFDKKITIYAGNESLGAISTDSSVTRGGRTYTLELDDWGALTLTVSGNATTGASGSDINGDHLSDVIMYHTKQGYAGAWKINENQKASWGNLSSMSSEWKIFDMGNTSDDNFNDIYLYNESGNKIGAWVVGTDGKVTGWKDVATFKDNMNILGMGDFNGDGVSDILLRSDYGDVGCYFTDGKGWNYFQSLGKEWTVAAVGDFNGDGIDDIVLTHKAGFAGCWLTQENGKVKWTNLDKLNGSVVAGAGDFNGDGVDDILLKNGDNYGAWIVDNGKAKKWVSLGKMTSGNVVEQIADFNGDGVDDLRIRTASGAIGTLCVTGDYKLEWNYYGSVGKEWSTSLAATV